MTKRENIIWAAGLLEGEGCFRVKPGSIKGYRASLVVNLSSTDRDVIDRVASTFGSHGKIHERTPKNPTHKKQYAVEWYGAAAEAVMRAVAPYVCARRADKIAECLATENLSHTKINEGSTT